MSSIFDEETEYDKEKEINHCKTSEKKDSKRKTRKGKQGTKGNFLKGKGRRIIFKKSVSLFIFIGGILKEIFTDAQLMIPAKYNY